VSAQPTIPPPGAGSALGQLWAAFRGLPTWGQGLLWIVLAPLLLALFLVRGQQPSRLRYVSAAAAILLLGPVWIGVASGSGEAPAPEVAAAPPAEERERPNSAPEPEPDPESEPEADETELEPEPVELEPAPEPAPAPAAPPVPDPDAAAAPTETGWRVVNIVDGDTIDVRNDDGVEERVRVVGIDTPERGECAFGEASIAMADLVMGEQVTLVAGAQDDRDRYDRILRYVDVGDTDAGLELIKLGLAIARYDSRDGYGEHPREDEYVAADAAMENMTCAPEPAPTPAAPPAPADAPSTEVTVFPNCKALNEVYPGGVARTDVTGNTVSGELRPFGKTPHFDDALYAANSARDGDNDGIACEQ
jgi:endonuclease YncB( thermonuclease family)